VQFKHSANVLEKSLVKLGLTDLEIKLYLYLYQAKPWNITRIAAEFGVSRVLVYKSVDNLIMKGIFKKHPNNQVIAQPPSTILSLLRYQETDLRRLSEDLSTHLAPLQSEYYSKKRSPVLHIYEGRQQFTLLLTRLVKESEEGEEMLWAFEGKDFYDVVDINYFEGILAEKKKAEKGPGSNSWNI
jgi:predicted DNA-binding transcriptional regulator